MAYAIHCKHCGWYESIHDDPSCLSDEEFTDEGQGYKISLNDCGGFVPEDPRAEAQAYADESRVGLLSLELPFFAKERINRNVQKFHIQFPSPRERQGMDDLEILLSILGLYRRSS